MSSTIIGWAGLLASLIFVAVAIGLSAQQRLSLTTPIVVSVARSLVQMMIVGVALVPLVRPQTPLWWSWLWVIGIVFFAAYTITRRAPTVPALYVIALAAMAAVAVVGLAVIFGARIFELNGRTLVPVAGMIVGNSMKSAVIAATRVSESVADHRAEIEAGLALGMTPRRAFDRQLRSALRTAISSQIEQTAALGIVFLPGAMTGLILAGVDPMEAVFAQLALMYVILAGVVIAVVVTGLGTLRRLTTADQRLVPVARAR
ncbi:ABC transporter permease [Rhodococcus oxybenzonivorans]|uniref:ABC transporter permease n=1 Tax=Rhodococcus TaxID=1827 RepID=UPI0020303028|nr:MULTISPECIES: ABC transporter permease [Rhodococcus]MDV7356259.1 ABC transporter permease [Rhodococcus oxybenzonivorans]